MESFYSYPSIYAMGHRAIADLMQGPVNVEEKVDGSQFSFGIDEHGELHVRSKGAVMYVEAPEAMFSEAVNTVKGLAAGLHPGWTYRAEYLQKPKHNALIYARIPAKHLIVFDINPALEEYLPYDRKQQEAARLGLETVPLLFEGVIEDLSTFRRFLDVQSILGGQLVEGVVVKPKRYDLFGKDKKVLMGKFVSESFKEIMGRTWKSEHPGQGDILDQLVATYTTQARWQKARLHLREAGQLEGSPRDIPKLIDEIPADILKEHEADIRDALFKWAWPHIRRRVTHGMPEWYKQSLLASAFDAD